MLPTFFYRFSALPAYCNKLPLRGKELTVVHTGDVKLLFDADNKK